MHYAYSYQCNDPNPPESDGDEGGKHNAQVSAEKMFGGGHKLSVSHRRWWAVLVAVLDLPPRRRLLGNSVRRAQGPLTTILFLLIGLGFRLSHNVIHRPSSPF